MDILSMNQVVMELVVNGGHARSKSMEAIKAARKGDIEFAKEK